MRFESSRGEISEQESDPVPHRPVLNVRRDQAVLLFQQNRKQEFWAFRFFFFFFRHWFRMLRSLLRPYSLLCFPQFSPIPPPPPPLPGISPYPKNKSRITQGAESPLFPISATGSPDVQQFIRMHLIIFTPSPSG